MAKRSYRRYTGRISRRSGGGGGRGIFSGLLAPIVGGMADAIINPRSPINGIGSAATGYLLKDQIIKEIGLYQVGQSIATFIPFLGAQSGGIASQV